MHVEPYSEGAYTLPSLSAGLSGERYFSIPVFSTLEATLGYFEHS
jgi:hypothetical protein